MLLGWPGLAAHLVVTVCVAGCLANPRAVARRARQLLSWLLQLVALPPPPPRPPRILPQPCAARDHCLMESDDILTEILHQLVTSAASAPVAARVLAGIAPVSKRFHRVAKLDSFWKPIALRRWHCQLKESEYVAAADEAASTTSPGVNSTTWREQFRAREEELVCDLPVFFTGTDLWPARPIGLHLVRGAAAADRVRWSVRHHPRVRSLVARWACRSLSQDTAASSSWPWPAMGASSFRLGHHATASRRGSASATR